MAEPPIDSDHGRALCTSSWEAILASQQKKVDLVVVLAAGEGTRMKSSLAKVLHPIAGKTVIHHVLEAVTPTSKEVSVVVGAHREEVEAHLSEIAPSAHRFTKVRMAVSPPITS